MKSLEKKTAFLRIYINARMRNEWQRERDVRSSNRPFPRVSFDFLISRLSIESGVVETGEIQKLVNHIVPCGSPCKLSGLILDRCVNRCNSRVSFAISNRLTNRNWMLRGTRLRSILPYSLSFIKSKAGLCFKQYSISKMSISIFNLYIHINILCEFFG